MPDNFAIIEAAAKGTKVIGLAYSGDKIRLNGWEYPLVIDISGMSIPATVPLLTNHENRTASRIGVVTPKVEANTITIEGEITSSNGTATGIIEQASAGASWQLSIGAVAEVKEMVAAGTRMINGILHQAPFIHVKKSTLREVSVVAIGADANAEMKIAAAYLVGADSIFSTGKLDIEKERNMEFEAYVKSLGLDLAKVTDEQKKKLEAAWKADIAASKKEDGEGKEPEKKVEAKQKDEPAKEIKASADFVDPVAQVREEHKRISEIKAACASYPEIEAKAIADGLSVIEAKALILDTVNARQGSEINAAYGINTGAGKATGSEVIEAAAVLGTGAVSKPENHYQENVLEAAHKLRNIGLKEIIRACAAEEGKHIQAGASVNIMAAAGFSTVSLPKMLGNIANKSLMEGFNQAESVSVKLAEKISANDFKQHTGVKLGGLGRMEAVQNGGQIKNGTMSEEYFNYRVNTKGMLVGLTEEMIQNDDLGGFTRMSKNLGIAAYNSREFDFWAYVLDNTGSFFSAGNGNYITAALSIDAITTALTALRTQTGIDGEPIALSAKYLVVPPQLEGTARAIYAGNAVQGSTSKTSNANIYQGVYEPAVTPHLQNSAVSDNCSTTGWYLWSDINKPFGIAYLNGADTPTVEEVDPDANFLGRAWRGVFRYGICQIEKRGAVMSTGAGS